MRKQQQQNILEILQTLEEAQAMGLYADCQAGALQVGEFIENIEGEGTETVTLLEEYCEILYRASINASNESSLRQQLIKIRDSIKSELKPNKYKALFLPYYDNTWETMKSVYEAFSRDPLFETQVVIIPIIRNTNKGANFVWEDYLTPIGIPNTHYDAYSFEEDLPDIVFYNQPYDGVNIPKFQSQNIRKYAGQMVYIPYGLHAIASMDEHFEHAQTGLKAMQRCDVFIAQSEVFRNYYMTGKPLYDKTIAVGHPKCDCLYSAKSGGVFTRYPEWEAAIGSRRVILFNTHFSYMVEGTHPHPGVRRLIDAVARNDSLFMIWRPHPQAFLMKMSVQMQVILDFAAAHGRMILDRTPSITPAYMYANAVVSLFPSSIVMDALFLDLPVFLLGRELKDNAPALQPENTVMFYDAVAHEDFDEPLPNKDPHSEQYQGYTERSIIAPLEAFLHEVEQGEDSKCEARAAFRAREFPNADGTIALKILEHMKKLLDRGAGL